MIGPATLTLLGLLTSATPSQTTTPSNEAAPFDPAAADTLRSDAELADVCFVDAQTGWAVGDRGTIWHTDDGGAHWRLQRSGVPHRLNAVCFVNHQVGWAAGGFSHPYNHTSSAVVLSTRDGGSTWRQGPNLALPAIERMRFADAKNGWAVGCGSAMMPSGAFVTDDGGRSWRALISPGAAASWLAADFVDENTGAVAGRTGALAVVRRSGIQPAAVGGLGLRNLRDLRLVGQLGGWLVGDGGLIMRTDDLGASWQTPPGRLPEGVSAQFDFAAIAVRGPKCWIAGSPGTRVLHTPDYGQTWHSYHTPSQVPLRGLCFVDDEHGWAVGALGTILATTDGGQSWRRQRAGGARAAMLGVFGSEEDLPLELFAQYSGNDGYLGVVEFLARRDVELPPRDEVHPADRAHEAVVAVGACGAETAWRFPLRQAGLQLPAEQILAGWDRANDARGLAQIEDHVVRQIRLWRPEVIVTHDASLRGTDPLGHLVNQIVLAAVEKAADPTSYAQQITAGGLEPWTVKKVYAWLPPPERGAIELPGSQWAARLGCSLSDAAALPRGLLEDRFTLGPETLAFRLLMCSLPQDQGRRDFFSGIGLSPGGPARRELAQPPAGSLDLLRRTAQRRRNLQAIVNQSGQSPQGSARLLGEAGELTRDMDGDSAAQLLHQLAQQYYRNGQWPLAADTFAMLADRYPDHPLAPGALLWLVQYYASGEAAWREQGKQRFAVQQTSALSIDLATQEDRPGRAAAFGKQIEQTRPDLFAQPALRFPLAVAERNRGFPQQADRYFLVRARGVERDAWWACAQTEQWLSNPDAAPPKPVLACGRAAAKPLLDGRLDDAVWRAARSAKLRSELGDDAGWPAAVMLAYDNEFLYLAIQCRQAPGADYAPAEGPRPRDPDLAAHDRVDVILDIDRDFATYYRLSIDHRGWPAEDCWGDSTWDPTWFVAADSADGVWTAEAAIPLDQLTGRYPGPRDVWAVGIQRTVPGVGFQSWNTPAAADLVPEGCGILIFE